MSLVRHDSAEKSIVSFIGKIRLAAGIIFKSCSVFAPTVILEFPFNCMTVARSFTRQKRQVARRVRPECCDRRRTANDDDDNVGWRRRTSDNAARRPHASVDIADYYTPVPHFLIATERAYTTAESR